MQRVYKQGFLMMELGLALVLLSFFFCLLGTWYVNGIKLQSEALKRWHTLGVVRSQIDQWRSKGGFPENGQVMEEGVKLSWESEPDVWVAGFRFIKITASYQGIAMSLKAGVLV